MLPLLELGGAGPLLHWAPANGFPFSTYAPIIEGLAPRFRSVAVPPRALRPDEGAAPAMHGTWRELSHDILLGLAEHDAGPVVAVGHSFGGVASILAATQEPGRFRGLILLDPTILPPDRAAPFRADQEAGWRVGYPLAIKCKVRKADFDSSEHAFDYWRGKGLFADWNDAALRRYVEGMLVPDGSGRFRLAWSPAWESYYYESIYFDTLDDLPRLPRSLPILAIAGGTTDTFMPESVALFREAVPWATVETIPGYGHLFPQSAPEATLDRMSRWLTATFG